MHLSESAFPPAPIGSLRLPVFDEKLIKIGAKVVGHARYVAFRMAEVAIQRNVFADIDIDVWGDVQLAVGATDRGVWAPVGASRLIMGRTRM
jgi:hypothetical protein